MQRRGTNWVPWSHSVIYFFNYVGTWLFNFFLYHSQLHFFVFFFSRYTVDRKERNVLIKIANDSILTWFVWYLKQQLCQLGHNHCQQNYLIFKNEWSPFLFTYHCDQIAGFWFKFLAIYSYDKICQNWPHWSLSDVQHFLVYFFEYLKNIKEAGNGPWQFVNNLIKHGCLMLSSEQKLQSSLTVKLDI